MGSQFLKVEKDSLKIESKKNMHMMTNEFYMVPICVETLGVWGPAGYKFIKELGRMTCETTMEKRSSSFIMEVQRINVACITAKGQTKSKCFFQADVSSKKRTNEFVF